MKRLEVSGAVRPIYGSLGVKRLIENNASCWFTLYGYITMHGQQHVTFYTSLSVVVSLLRPTLTFDLPCFCS